MTTSRVLILSLLILGVASAQQLPIRVSLSGSPPTFIPFFLGIPGRAVSATSATWGYTTYDYEPSRFYATAGITFSVGNLNSYILRSVWSDVASGRVDYDGHAATTLYLPCNRTYRLVIYDSPDAGAPILSNFTLALTSCNASLMPFYVDAGHQFYESGCASWTQWKNIPVYLGRTSSPYIPSASSPFGRLTVTLEADKGYGKYNSTLKVLSYLSVNRTVTNLQASQQNATLIAPSLVVASDLYPRQTVPILTGGASTMNALDPVTEHPVPFVSSGSFYTYTDNLGSVFMFDWATHQSCDARISFVIRLNDLNNDTQTTLPSTFVAFIRTPVVCLASPTATLPEFQIQARRLDVQPPFLIRDGLNRTWSATLDVAGGRSSVASNNTRHLLVFPQLILTNASFPLSSAFPSPSSFVSAPWFVQRAIVTYSNGDVVDISPVTFVEIRGTRGPISFAFDVNTTPLLRCGQTTSIVLQSNSTSFSVVGPYVFNVTCSPAISTTMTLCDQLQRRTVNALEGLVTLIVLLMVLVAILAVMCICRKARQD